MPLWACGELIPLTTEGKGLSVHEYTEKLPGLGVLRLTPVNPAADATLLHGFVTARHTTFWGMSEYTVDEVRKVYEFLDSLTTHHAYLIRLDDEPIGIFQTYEPAADPVGERYPAQPGDIGMHLLLAPTSSGSPRRPEDQAPVAGTARRPPRGLVDALGLAFARFLFADPAKDRIVVEPDIRNEAALRRLRTEVSS